MNIINRYLRSQCGGQIVRVEVAGDYTLEDIAREVHHKTIFDATSFNIKEDYDGSDWTPGCDIATMGDAPKGYSVITVTGLDIAETAMLADLLNDGGRESGRMTLCTEEARFFYGGGCGDCDACYDGYPEDCEVGDHDEESHDPPRRHAVSVSVAYHHLEGSRTIIGVADFGELEKNRYLWGSLRPVIDVWDDCNRYHGQARTADEVATQVYEGLHLYDDAAFMLEPYNVAHNMVDENRLGGGDSVVLSESHYPREKQLLMPHELYMRVARSDFTPVDEDRPERRSMTLDDIQVGIWNYSGHELPTLLSVFIAQAFAPKGGCDTAWYFLSCHAKMQRPGYGTGFFGEARLGVFDTFTLIHWFRHFPEAMIKAASEAGFEIEEIKTFKPTRNGNEALHSLDAVAIKGGWVI